MLDGVVFRAVRRVVGHADFQADALGETFQVILEHVAIGSVAAAAVAQQKQASRLRIGRLSMPLPPQTETVASEAAGVVAEAKVQVSEVAFDVVETMRIDHAERGAGKIVIQGFLGFLRVQSALTKQKSQEFLVFGVHAHDGIGRLGESGAVMGDDLKLSIAIGMASHGERLARLATPQAMAFQKLGHNADTHAKASPQKFLGDLGTRKIRPQNAILIGIARRVRIDDLQKVLVDSWEKRQAPLPAAFFFRARSGGNGGSG